VVPQTKQSGSALFETSEGDVLIEITQDQKGYFIFKAVGESLEPIVMYEGRKKTSGAAWEVQMSTYLQELVGSSSQDDYGVSAERWRGEKFSALFALGKDYDCKM